MKYVIDFVSCATIKGINKLHQKYTLKIYFMILLTAVERQGSENISKPSERCALLNRL